MVETSCRRSGRPLADVQASDAPSVRGHGSQTFIFREARASTAPFPVQMVPPLWTTVEVLTLRRPRMRGTREPGGASGALTRGSRAHQTKAPTQPGVGPIVRSVERWSVGRESIAALATLDPLTLHALSRAFRGSPCAEAQTGAAQSGTPGLWCVAPVRRTTLLVGAGGDSLHRSAWKVASETAP